MIQSVAHSTLNW